jgi:hypothetical protein
MLSILDFDIPLSTHHREHRERREDFLVTRWLHGDGERQARELLPQAETLFPGREKTVRKKQPSLRPLR